MWKVDENFRVRLGGNTHTNSPRLIVHKGTPLFQLRRRESDGMLEIDLDIFDVAGQRVCIFRKGVVARGDTDSYIVAIGKDEFRVIERRSGRIIAMVKRCDAEGVELDAWVRLYTPNGLLIDATPDELNLEGSKGAKGSVYQNRENGIIIV